MANKTIYTRDDELWRVAVEQAYRERISVSALIEKALSAYLSSATECHTCNTIRKLLDGRLDVRED